MLNPYDENYFDCTTGRTLIRASFGDPIFIFTKHITLRCLLIVVVTIFCCQYSFAQKELNVLFVGNSLTYYDSRNNEDFPYYNDMFPTLREMIKEKKLNIHLEKVTHGGASLVNHATFIGTDGEMGIFRRVVAEETPSTIMKIQSKHWDAVVLQEAGASLSPALSHYTTEPALHYLDSIIKIGKSKTVLYQAYSEPRPQNTYLMYNGQKFPKTHYKKLDTGFALKILFSQIAFDPDDIPKIAGRDTFFYADSFRNSMDEFRAIAKEYKRIAAPISADVVEVGLAFEQCKRQFPGIPLYYDDMNDDNNGHPSRQGAYLIACMFYKYLTGQNVDKVKYHSEGVSEDEAKKLRKVADSIHSVHYSQTGKSKY